MALSDLMDGWAHQMVPGVDFLGDQALDVLDCEEADEDGLDPYESGSPIISWSEPFQFSGGHPDGPFAIEGMLFSGVNLALQDLSEIVGGGHDAHHRHTYDDAGHLEQPEYWWRFVAGAEGFQGEGARL